MKTNNLTKTVMIFVLLTITGVLMVVLPQASNVAEVQRVLPLLGTAIFSSALTFFMVEVFRSQQK